MPRADTPNPFSGPIQSLLTLRNHSPTPTPAETAADLVNSVTTSSDPAHALWELDPHLALLATLRAHPPTQPKLRARCNVSSSIEADRKPHWQKLPQFSAQWRDVHDILEAWRDWDGVRDSGADNSTISTLSSSGGEYFLRFCVFSAALLKASKGKGNVHLIWGFFACRDGLEYDGPHSRLQKARRMSSEQLWALDA